MTVEFAAFEISDYLEDEAVITEYLLAAGDDPDPEVPPLQAHVEGVLQKIAAIALVGGPLAKLPVLDHDPAHVPPEPGHQRAMRVRLPVGMLVMQAVNHHPARWRASQ